eukprot:12783493-Alexandrium_andersonii.AAC.1
MSASLVGSEMCIRDSFKTKRTSSRRGSGPSTAPWAPATCGWAGHAYKDCLLYTSDAADDM